MLEVLRGIRDTADHVEAQTPDDVQMAYAAMENSGFAGYNVSPSTYSEVFRDEAIAAAIQSQNSVFRWDNGSTTPICWNFKE